MIEDMLAALCAAEPAWAVAVQCYFNPVARTPAA